MEYADAVGTSSSRCLTSTFRGRWAASVPRQKPCWMTSEEPGEPGGNPDLERSSGPTRREERTGGPGLDPLPAQHIGPTPGRRRPPGEELVSVNRLFLPASPGPVADACGRPPRALVLVTTTAAWTCLDPRLLGPPRTWTCYPGEDAWPSDKDAWSPTGPGPAGTLSERAPTTTAPWTSSPPSGSTTCGLPGSPCAPTPPAGVFLLLFCLGRDFDTGFLFASHPGILRIFLPVPAVLRCIRRGCNTSYGGASWTSRVQSLRRHLEREHGERVQERLYLCSVCSESLPARPSCHPCLASTSTPADTAAPRHRCVRCPQAFPSARGLINHERWHDVQDATAAASGRLPSSAPPPRPSDQSPSPSGGTTTSDSSPARHHVSEDMFTPPPLGDTSPARATTPLPDPSRSTSPSGSGLGLPGTRRATSPPPSDGTASPDTQSSVFMDAADDTSEASTADPDHDSAIPPDHTALLANQARLLRRLLREPPSEDSWDECEATWTQAVSMATEAVSSSGSTSPLDPDLDAEDDGDPTPPVDEPAMDSPPDNTSLLGAQSRLLRELIRAPPTDATWAQCEAAWTGGGDSDRFRAIPVGPLGLGGPSHTRLRVCNCMRAIQWGHARWCIFRCHDNLLRGCLAWSSLDCAGHA
ncbi:hypothetical protein HPB52_023197 [Rhipicephalus sanguineus]|uniref:C2H2-type domain-containing protein n=1 Tax=Rhipicephalus sanguineus TaxID=34632 RepID=A0A9D4QDI1_RHISA|nr:hypothetical protein HPB52_023197 [Rhipicephalus sanguineus]